MNHVPTSTICVLLTLVLSGCVISVRDDGMDAGWHDEEDWRQRQERNQQALAYLELGRSVGSVTDELGPADLTESFVREGQTYRVLFYRTHRMHSDGRTTRDETVPLVFVDGELVGWGDSALAYAQP